MKERKYYWDNIKGILIILVVMLHYIPTEPNSILRAICLYVNWFHMPLFIFVSGVFYKRTNIKERILGLVLVGLVYNCALIILDNLLLHSEQEFYIFRATKIPWFVFCIAGCTLVTYLIGNVHSGIILGVSILLGCMACYDDTLMNYMTLAKMVGWYPFFYLGYFLKKKGYETKIEKFSSKKYSIFLGGGIIVLSLLFVISTRRMEYNIFEFSDLFGCQKVFSDSSLAWIFLKLIYYIGVCIISVGILCVVQNREIVILSYLGKRTMQIYFWHILVRSILISVGIRERLCSSIYGTIIWILVSFGIILLLSTDFFKFPTTYILKGIKSND